MTAIVNQKDKVYQPVRSVNAYYNFTSTQEDLIMLVQKKTKKLKTITNDFTIDLKEYFADKNIDLKNVRYNHYLKLTSDLLESKVTFKYFTGDRLYTHQNLFSRCTITKDFKLEVSIIDEALPLFYINKLKDDHFEGNRLIKDRYEKSYPEYDNYVAYLPKTFVQFKESRTKKLFTKLLQYRKLGKYEYEFSKDELYLLLGYGYLIDKEEQDPQQKIFNIVEQEFIQTYYKGVNGWKSLRPKLNDSLKEITDNKESGVNVIAVEKNYFTTTGRPIRSIFINVKYDDKLIDLTEDQKKSYEFLKPLKVSHNQKLKIVSDYNFTDIFKLVNDSIVTMKNNKGDQYYAEKKRADFRKINNLSGYVYAIVFGYGRK